MAHRTHFAAFAICGALGFSGALSESVPPRGIVDSRVRISIYNGDEVYKIRGFVGYQIDIEFEAGEVFTGLGAGDLEGLSFVGQDNHLFLKPKAATVTTNLTVLTSRRHYQFDYSATSQRPSVDEPGVIYALRFTYPSLPVRLQRTSQPSVSIRNWKALQRDGSGTSTIGIAAARR